MWVFNRHVWYTGSSMLSPRHICAESLAYMCQYIRSIGSLPKAIETVIVDKFHESLTDMIQRRGDSSSEYTPPSESWQWLYSALLARSMDEPPDLVTLDATAAVPSGNLNSHILKLLYV